MKSNVEALQALYVELGGSLTDTYATIADGVPVSDYDTIPDMIEAVSNVAGGSGGGASLPKVTTSDNGDVLTVVKGKWAKAEPQTGEPLFVNFTASGGTYSCDKTLAEIEEAWATSKNIFGYNAETGYVLPLVLCNSSVAIFSSVALIAQDTFAGMAVQVTSEGVTYEQDTLANRT